MVDLPSTGGKGSEEDSLVKARILRLEAEWLSSSMKDLLPRGQRPLTQTVKFQTPCHRPVHSTRATKALLPEVGSLGWA